MLAAPAIDHQGPHSGLRPFNPRRDSLRLGELLNLCFGPFQDYQGRRYDFLQGGQFRNTPYLASLTPTDRRVVPGFVWEEDGDLLANISLIRSPLKGRFLIANVAVHPDHRRKGLARRLMDESVQHLQDKGVQEILLQVQRENAAAHNLYRSLGFSYLGSMSQWQASASKIRLLNDDHAAHVFLTKLDRHRWREAYQLDILALDPNLNWPAPPTRKKYKRGIWRWLNDFLNAKSSKTWVTEARTPNNSSSLSGLVNLHTEWSRPNRIELRIRPGYAPFVARALLGFTFRKVHRLSGSMVRLDHEASDEQVNQLLREANFKNRRVLTVMRLVLN